jgi:hypothetical protein
MIFLLDDVIGEAIGPVGLCAGTFAAIVGMIYVARHHFRKERKKERTIRKDKESEEKKRK